MGLRFGSEVVLEVHPGGLPRQVAHVDLARVRVRVRGRVRVMVTVMIRV